MGSDVAKVFYFADAPEMPWFQANLIMTQLGFVNITRTLDCLESHEKQALKDLVESKGAPPGGRSMNERPLGYNDGKAKKTSTSTVCTR